jgi:hypothetical protein
LQYHFNWKTISVAAAMTLWNFYFQIFEKAIAKEQVVEFLANLVQQLTCPLLIVWSPSSWIFFRDRSSWNICRPTHRN